VVTFKEFNAKDEIIIALLPVLTLVFTGLISSENKARLVYWRLKNALPGHRVFSTLVKRDSRIDIQNLNRKMGGLPQEPKEQNIKWYSIYKQYSESITVKEEHRNYLLSRDLCSISFLFTLFGPWGIIIFQQTWKWALVYFVVMFTHYFILALVAKNHGNRFVCNVIAEYLNNPNA